MAKGLNPHTIAVYQFIVEYKIKHGGNSPSIREIGDGSGITSTSNVTYHLKKLIEYGAIECDFNTPRNITVVGGQWVAPTLHQSPEALRQLYTAQI